MKLPLSFRKYRTRPLEAVQILAKRYMLQRSKLTQENRFFFQHFDSMQHTKRYIYFYGDIYRTSILFRNTRRNIAELDKTLAEVRKQFGLQKMRV